MQPIEQADAYPQTVIGKWFGVTSREADKQLCDEPSSASFNKAVSGVIGLFLTPTTLAGALLRLDYQGSWASALKVRTKP